MKKNTFLKPFPFLLACICVVSFGYGQTKLAEITFESAGGYTTSIPEFTDGGQDYFLRTDDSDITGTIFTNQQGSYFFAAQDIDGEGAVLPVTFLLDNVNISGYSSIEFRVHLAEDAVGSSHLHWDNADYVHFNYDIDNTGTFSNLLWIENDGGGNNRAPLIDTDFDGNGDGTPITSDFDEHVRSIAGTGSLLDIQIVFNLNSGAEDIAIDNIEIWGTLAPCAGGAVTWDGAAWDNAGVGPDISTPVILNGAYNTSVNGGSFSACSLTVNTGRLTVADGDYVEVQNDVTVNGQLWVETQGNFVQNNDSASFTDNTTNANDLQVTKSKTMQRLLSYTYWSSPVVGETIEQTFGGTISYRRFRFEAANFVDMLEEIGNTGTFLNNPGVDDLDDDGNDWVLASGAMQPGIGYTAVASEFGPAFPRTEDFFFRGPFNNGVISIPLVNNSGELYNDWNFIGNPYPSAIDADQFFSVNAGIVDAIYLWDQATPESSNAGGSQTDNFSVDDYAMLNSSGGVGARGGTGSIPNGSVASGQGFFVEALASSNVTFNNSMRMIGTIDNTQFFRGSNAKVSGSNNNTANKLWVNLTSDNGVFNQILLSYVEGATSANDGSRYDAKRILSSGSPSILYTNINNDTGKFAIQGKSPSNLTEAEIISLGFKTSIDIATLYTLSISQFQGNFFNNRPIYLKDNLLNKTHDLSVSDYTFTSEVGEFNDRFEIAFSAQALSNDAFNVEAGTLRIVTLDNDLVQFTVPKDSSIASVTIFDMLGRQLYSLKGQNNSETYKLSKLNSSIFIAKVGLTDGTIITKKAIKK